jgi:hypothetical protein
MTLAIAHREGETKILDVIRLAVGLALIGAAISRLDLFETLGANTLAVVAGFALVLLGAFAIATYGVIRAIEWVSRER